MAENAEGIQERASPVERLKRENLRKIAGVGLAVMAALGAVSGKGNVGGAADVEVFNPVTGKNVTVGVSAESTEKDIFQGLGVGEKHWDPDSIRAYTVQIGGAKLSVYYGEKTDPNNPTVTRLVVINAGAQRLGK